MRTVPKKNDNAAFKKCSLTTKIMRGVCFEGRERISKAKYVFAHKYLKQICSLWIGWQERKTTDLSPNFNGLLQNYPSNKQIGRKTTRKSHRFTIQLTSIIML